MSEEKEIPALSGRKITVTDEIIQNLNRKLKILLEGRI